MTAKKNRNPWKRFVVILTQIFVFNCLYVYLLVSLSVTNSIFTSFFSLHLLFIDTISIYLFIARAHSYRDRCRFCIFECTCDYYRSNFYTSFFRSCSRQYGTIKQSIFLYCSLKRPDHKFDLVFFSFLVVFCWSRFTNTHWKCILVVWRRWFFLPGCWYEHYDLWLSCKNLHFMCAMSIQNGLELKINQLLFLSFVLFIRGICTNS